MKQYLDSTPCVCGKTHFPIDIELIMEKGALKKLPALIRRFGGKKPFVFADINTYEAAGKAVCELLGESEIPYSLYVFEEKHLEPDENQG